MFKGLASGEVPFYMSKSGGKDKSTPDFDYKVIKTDSLSDLEKEVALLLNKGWQLKEFFIQGNIFAQTLVRKIIR